MLIYFLILLEKGGIASRSPKENILTIDLLKLMETNPPAR